MRIKGTEVVKLLNLLQDVLEEAVTPEQHNSDDESFETLILTPIETLHTTATNRPDELLDITVIKNTVLDVLKSCSIDINKTDRAAKLFNVLNTDFNESASYLDLLLSSMLNNTKDLDPNEPDKNPAITIISDLSHLFGCTAFKSVPHVANLLATLQAHELSISMKIWEDNWHKNYSAVSEYHSRRVALLEVREELFKQCDQLFKDHPKEFRKLLIDKDFPAQFFLDYLSDEYHREIDIQAIDPKLLVLNLAAAVDTLLVHNCGTETKQVLKKIAVALETGAAGSWTPAELKKTLGSIIVKLIVGYANQEKSIDGEYNRRMAVNFLGMVKDLNITDQNCNTPLHAAIPSKSSCTVKIDFIKWLLANGANVNAINKQGQTPLSMAAKNLKDNDAAAVISAMLKNPMVGIATLEQGLYKAILSNETNVSLADSKVFELLTNELDVLGWEPVAFFVDNSVFLFNNIKELSFYDARQNIINVTKLLSAMQLLKIPFNKIFAARIKSSGLYTSAIVGALLANRNLCKQARSNVDDNVFEYLKQHPETCSYLNQNIGNVMRMLMNINPENSNIDSDFKDCFATSDDILKICTFNNNESPEYLLFTLRILVEKVFYTQLIPASALSLFTRNSFWNIQEQVKQQLRGAVFAMIDRDENIDPIKQYLTEQDSGLNQIFFRSFVHNFLNEIHKREIARRQDKLSINSGITHAYGRLSTNFPSDGVLDDLEAGQVSSKFSSQISHGPQ